MGDEREVGAVADAEGIGSVIAVTSLSRTTATDVPMSWVYLAVPVGCVLIGIETLRLMARTWRNLGKEEWE